MNLWPAASCAASKYGLGQWDFIANLKPLKKSDITYVYIYKFILRPFMKNNKNIQPQLIWIQRSTLMTAKKQCEKPKGRRYRWTYKIPSCTSIISTYKRLIGLQSDLLLTYGIESCDWIGPFLFFRWIELIFDKLVGGVLHMNLFWKLLYVHYRCKLLFYWDTRINMGRIYHGNIITDPCTMNIFQKILQSDSSAKTQEVLKPSRWSKISMSLFF